jgi:uncharacterized Zn-binding protein involved in type VI secretion
VGKPAARVGDPTVHGGSIVGPGVPTVMIGGMPAAVVGDNHLCPMVTPAPAPVPHVGGPVAMGCFVVLIGGKPAARMGDMCVCTGPPDSIAMGCPTVLIGEGGGGGAGMGQGGAAQKASDTAKEVKTDEGHYLDVTFTDKGGFPIGGVGYEIKAPDGTISTGALASKLRKGGIAKGNYEITLKAITHAKWSKKSAKVGDKVKLTAQTSGIPSGEPAKCEIFIRDSNYADKLLKSLDTTVDNDKVEVEWEFQVDETFEKIQSDKDKTPRYSSPAWYFTVTSAGLTMRSDLLKYQDFIELKLKDDQGKPLANKKFRLYLANGEIRNGQLDGSGYAKVDKIPPGNVRVSFDVKQ